MPDSSLIPHPSSLFFGRHSLDVLREQPSESIHCICTSPPYWGLRNYGTQPQIWPSSLPTFTGGQKVGSESCPHIWGELLPPKPGRGNKPGDYSTSSLTNPDRQDEIERPKNSRAFCSLCNSWRGELGHEPTPELYVQHLTLIFRECRRVLRSDGTLWLNMGDSYCGPPVGHFTGGGFKDASARAGTRDLSGHARGSCIDKSQVSDLKSKDLVGIPWMVAFALRADGWYLRQEIIWHKPNPMPESVTDRCTKSHESIFLFSQSGTAQYWTHRDGKGARQEPEPDYQYQHITGYETADEPPDWRTSRIACPACNGTGQRNVQLEEGLFGAETMTIDCDECDEETHTVAEWTRINLWQGHDYFFDHLAIAEPLTRPEEPDRKTPARFGGADKFEETFKQSRLHSGNEYKGTPTGTRNRRSVWVIPTTPYPEAHYAVFPPELPRLCILAGTSAHGCCPICSAPYERIIEKGFTAHDGASDTDYAAGSTANRLAKLRQASRARGQEYVNDAHPVGWQPTCSCSDAEIGIHPSSFILHPCIVLDPFCGSGTTLAVAAELGRNYIGIELDEKNRKLCKNRLARANHTLNIDL